MIIKEAHAIYASCEICGVTKILKRDHNHHTGEVRGCLCSSCNRGIEYLGDSPNVLRKAIQYLETRGYYEARQT